MALLKSVKPRKKSSSTKSRTAKSRITKSRATKSAVKKAMQKTIARYGNILKELARR